MAIINPIQTESGRTAENNPVNPIFLTKITMPSTDIVVVDPVALLTEGQDFPTGTGGAEM